MAGSKKKNSSPTRSANKKKKVVKNQTKSRVVAKKEQEKAIRQKRRKIKVRNILLVFLAISILFLCGYFLLQVPIGSIVIKGNQFLSDQEIIDMAGIRDYPSTLKTTSRSIQKELETYGLVLKVNVQKRKFLREVVITVTENRPLFYYQPDQKSVLQDGTKVEGEFPLPVVLNQIPDTVYQRFLKKMVGVPNDVLRKISEIRYYPNEVDSELFLMAMNDGNYVYVTLPKFERLYNYLEYVESFGNKKGILHLDSGDYLEILEGK